MSKPNPHQEKRVREYLEYTGGQRVGSGHLYADCRHDVAWSSEHDPADHLAGRWILDLDAAARADTG